ncbi:MAG: hypothetical protein ACPG6R_10925 [Aequoribacter sp.]|uniref:hypothetical protein n=1 Tax=Aequoribacter sp. TaxID=2847771 RepID=UPI003C3717CA
MFERRDQEIIAKIQNGAGASNNDVVNEIVAASKRQRGVDHNFDERMNKLRKFFDGKHLEMLERAMQARFPSTWHRVPKLYLNIVRHVCETDAFAYDDAIERVVKDNEQATEDLGELAESAKLDEVMTYAESVLMAAKCIFLFLGYDKVQGRLRIRVFWPHCAHLLAHPDSADSTDGLVAAVLELDGNVREVWTRAYEDRDDEVVFGPWRAERIDKEGRIEPLFGDGIYPAHLPTPILSLRDEYSDTLYVDAGHDLAVVQDSVNVALSDNALNIDLNASPRLVRKTDQLRGQDVVFGTGAMVDIAQGDDLIQLPSDVNMAGLDSVERILAILATTRQQPGDAYATERSNESGVARQVKLLPQSKAQRRRRTRYKEFEETRLLPTLAAIEAEWGEIDIAGNEFVARFPDQPMFEDAEAKQRRNEQAEDNGWISPARAAAESGFYDSIADAVEAGLSDELPRNAPQPDGGGLASLTAGLRGLAAPLSPPAESAGLVVGRDEENEDGEV